MLYAVNTGRSGARLLSHGLPARAGASACVGTAVRRRVVQPRRGGVVRSLSRGRRLKPDARRQRTGSAGVKRPASARHRQRSALRPQPFATLAHQPGASRCPGFAAMGMEILWFRHVSILLGGFRAVFSLLMTVILVGIGGDRWPSGVLHRRAPGRRMWLMVAQGSSWRCRFWGWPPPMQRAIEQRGDWIARFTWRADSNRRATRTLQELWFNARPILPGSRIARAPDGFRFSARQRPHAARRSRWSAAAQAFSTSPIPAARSAAASQPASCCCRRSGSRAQRDGPGRGSRARDRAAVFRDAAGKRAGRR